MQSPLSSRPVIRCLCYSIALLALSSSLDAQPQQSAQTQVQLRGRRDSLERELQRIAIVDRKLMIPMRDGTRIQADVYRPRNSVGKVPIIFSRTPYNFNWWDVRLGAPADMTSQLEAVKRGYALVIMNERGHYFSEGNYDILGPPLSDGVDEIQWMSSQPWANGKVGLIGCSSTAEWQMAVAAQGPSGSLGGQLAFVEDQLSVNDHRVDALRIPGRIGVGRAVDHLGRVEDDQVRRHPGPQHAPVQEAHAPRGQRGHLADRLLDREEPQVAGVVADQSPCAAAP